MNNKRKPTPEILRLKVLDEGNYTCIYCGNPASTVDHIIPYSWVQKHEYKNLVPSCRTCNSIAGDKVFSGLIEKMEYMDKKLAGRKKKNHVPVILEHLSRPKTSTRKTTRTTTRTTRRPDPNQTTFTGPPEGRITKEVYTARLLVSNYGYDWLADKTGYSYSYIHQVCNGKLRAGKKLSKAIFKIYREEFQPAGRKSKPTVTIRYDDPEQQKKHLQLSNTQRIRALTLYYNKLKAHEDIEEKAKKAILLDTN